MVDELAERIAGVRRAVEDAAARVGRDPAGIRIVAVTKALSPGVVSAAIAAGLTEIGENYVQEARTKQGAVGRRGVWHLIGTLQRNKARAAVAIFDHVQTVDSDAVAGTLDREAERARRRLPVLIQVNVSGEATKSGVAPERVEALARGVLLRPSLLLQGLMAVPPIPEDPDASRPYFRLLRGVRDRTANVLGVELPHLSMGMSDDFLVAVEEGATLLRLGRALFGARGPGASRPGSSPGGEGS